MVRVPSTKMPAPKPASPPGRRKDRLKLAFDNFMEAFDVASDVAFFSAQNRTAIIIASAPGHAFGRAAAAPSSLTRALPRHSPPPPSVSIMTAHLLYQSFATGSSYPQLIKFGYHDAYSYTARALRAAHKSGLPRQRPRQPPRSPLTHASTTAAPPHPQAWQGTPVLDARGTPDLEFHALSNMLGAREGAPSQASVPLQTWQPCFNAAGTAQLDATVLKIDPEMRSASDILQPNNYGRDADVHQQLSLAPFYAHEIFRYSEGRLSGLMICVKDPTKLGGANGPPPAISKVRCAHALLSSSQINEESINWRLIHTLDGCSMTAGLLRRVRLPALRLQQCAPGVPQGTRCVWRGAPGGGEGGGSHVASCRCFATPAAYRLPACPRASAAAN